MLEDSYLCEANIEAAKIMIDKEWKKSEELKDSGGRSIYLALSCIYPSSIISYYGFILNTHGGY